MLRLGKLVQIRTQLLKRGLLLMERTSAYTDFVLFVFLFIYFYIFTPIYI